MTTRFIATTAEDAQLVFGRRFIRESAPGSQAEVDERFQLGGFLSLYSLSGGCRFPIEVEVLPRACRPDFRVRFGDFEVDVEASKIASSELEELRNIQRVNVIGTMEVSTLLLAQAEKPAFKSSAIAGRAQGGFLFILSPTNFNAKMLPVFVALRPSSSARTESPAKRISLAIMARGSCSGTSCLMRTRSKIESNFCRNG